LATGRMTPVQAAKELGIRPQIVYGYIRSGRISTFPNPDGKTSLVELADVQRLASGTKHHRPKDPTTGKPINRSAGVSPGSLLSSHGNKPRQRRNPRHSVEVVTGVTHGEDGQEFVHYTKIREDGSKWEFFWEGEQLADALAKGTCRIESPESLLASVMFHWGHNGRPDLAAELFTWAQGNGLDVPTITEVADAEPTIIPVTAVEAEAEPEEVLHGEP